MGLLNKLSNWLDLSKKAQAKKAFNEKVKAIKAEHQEWQNHFNRLKLESEPIRGYVADIRYVNIDELSKNRYAAEITDMILWISFRFANSAEKTVRYYQKPGYAQFEDQRRMLEFSGCPSILEYGAIGATVLGYFKDGELVALENMPIQGRPENFTDPVGEEY